MALRRKMSDERFRCDNCKGIGNGLAVGEDPITGLNLCPKCLQEVTLKRVLGDDWGEKTSMRTDPNINVPLPEPTLEEAVGSEAAQRIREQEKMGKAEATADHSLADRVNKMEETLNKILKAVGGDK